MKKETKKIKAWAVIDKDKKICSITDSRGFYTGQMAIYEPNVKWDKKIIKSYKLKIVPCEIIMKN